jgi:hypothetical protein
MLNIKSIVKNPEKKFYVDVMFKNDENIYTRRTYKEKEFDGKIYSFVFSGVKVFFDLTTMDVIDQKVIYETKGIKKTSTYIGSKRIKEVKPLEKKTVNVENKNNTEVKHEKYDQIKTCLECNIPIYLAGPAGSGKNFTVEQIAKELGWNFYFSNSVQQEYKLTGFIDAGGKFHDTEFYKACTDENDCIFFLDEMDASIPEVLVLLNAAIANGNKELVDFVHSLRSIANNNGIRATFSYRCITMVTKLESAGMDLKTILTISVFKGMDKDTINTFNAVGYDKYTKALKDIQMAA